MHARVVGGFSSCIYLCLAPVPVGIQYASVRETLGKVIQQHNGKALTEAETKRALEPALTLIERVLSVLSGHVYRPVMLKLLLHLWSGVAVELHNCLLPTVAYENEITKSIATVRSQQCVNRDRDSC